MILLTVERRIGSRRPCPTKKPEISLNISTSSLPSEFVQRKDSPYTVFLCSTRRFDERQNINPAPGQYHVASTYVKDSNKCGSVSTRGYTSLTSLDPRFSNLIELKSQSLPGPATYWYASSLGTTKRSIMKIKFSKHNTARSKRKRETSSTPGPGHYYCRDKAKVPNLGASSFKFTARKESDALLLQDTIVAVGRYDVSRKELS